MGRACVITLKCNFCCQGVEPLGHPCPHAVLYAWTVPQAFLHSASQLPSFLLLRHACVFRRVGAALQRPASAQRRHRPLALHWPRLFDAQRLQPERHSRAQCLRSYYGIRIVRAFAGPVHQRQRRAMGLHRRDLWRCIQRILPRREQQYGLLCRIQRRHGCGDADLRRRCGWDGTEPANVDDDDCGRPGGYGWGVDGSPGSTFHEQCAHQQRADQQCAHQQRADQQCADQQCADQHWWCVDYEFGSQWVEQPRPGHAHRHHYLVSCGDSADLDWVVYYFAAEGMTGV